MVHTKIWNSWNPWNSWNSKVPWILHTKIWNTFELFEFYGTLANFSNKIHGTSKLKHGTHLNNLDSMEHKNNQIIRAIYCFTTFSENFTKSPDNSTSRCMRTKTWNSRQNL